MADVMARYSIILKKLTYHCTVHINEILSIADVWLGFVYCSQREVISLCITSQLVNTLYILLNRQGRIGANWKVLPLNHPCKQKLSHYTKGNSHEGIITASKGLSNMNLSWKGVKNAQNNWNKKLLANEIRLT